MELTAKRAQTLEQSPQAVSMVIGPSGEVISDMLCEAEGLLYQQIDISHCVEPKQFHDVVGYYNRFDVFDLRVNRKRIVPIAFSDDEGNDGVEPSGREIYLAMAPAHFPSLPRYPAWRPKFRSLNLLGKSIIDLSAKQTNPQGTTAGTTPKTRPRTN